MNSNSFMHRGEGMGGGKIGMINNYKKPNREEVNNSNLSKQLKEDEK